MHFRHIRMDSDKGGLPLSCPTVRLLSARPIERIFVKFNVRNFYKKLSRNFKFG
jgi:hypothetical protein